MLTKICNKCSVELPIDCYYKVSSPQSKAKFYGHCKKCHAALCKKWTADNRDFHLSYRRDWMKAHRDGNYEKYRARELKYKCKNFGTTPEWYTQKLQEQNGVCGICLRAEVSRAKRDRRVRRLAIDHCHKTGVVRGLLCSACNQAVGMIDNYPGWIERATSYLSERHD